MTECSRPLEVCDELERRIGGIPGIRDYDDLR